MMEVLRRLAIVAFIVCLGLTVLVSSVPRQDTYSCDRVALVQTNEDDELAIEVDYTIFGVKVVRYEIDFGDGSKVRITPSTTLLYPYQDKPSGTYTLTATLVVERSDGSQAAVTSMGCRIAVSIEEGIQPSPS